MEADRPNHNLQCLASVAVDIAVKQSRLAAVKFLFDRGCAPEMIAHVLDSPVANIIPEKAPAL